MRELAQDRFRDRDLQRLPDRTWRLHTLFYRRHKPATERSFDDHDELIEALAAGDAERIGCAVRDHLCDRAPSASLYGAARGDKGVGVPNRGPRRRRDRDRPVPSHARPEGARL